MNVVSILKVEHIEFLLPLTYITVHPALLAHKHILIIRKTLKEAICSLSRNCDTIYNGDRWRARATAISQVAVSRPPTLLLAKQASERASNAQSVFQFNGRPGRLDERVSGVSLIRYRISPYTCKPVAYVVVKVRHTWCNAAQIVTGIPNYEPFPPSLPWPLPSILGARNRRLPHPSFSPPPPTAPSTGRARPNGALALFSCWGACVYLLIPPCTRRTLMYGETYCRSHTRVYILNLQNATSISILESEVASRFLRNYRFYSSCFFPPPPPPPERRRETDPRSLTHSRFDFDKFCCYMPREYTPCLEMREWDLERYFSDLGADCIKSISISALTYANVATCIYI